MSERELPKDLSYRDAVAELERILARIESEETDLDDLASHVERAALLIEHCRHRIEATQARVQKVFDAMEQPPTAVVTGSEGQS